MKNIGLCVAGMLVLMSACSALTSMETSLGVSSGNQAAVASAASQAVAGGQLFCALDKSTGTIVVGLIDATATVAGAAAPAIVAATNATQAFVQVACSVAAAAEGAAAGIPVSPPANPAAAPLVAIVPPAVHLAS